MRGLCCWVAQEAAPAAHEVVDGGGGVNGCGDVHDLETAGWGMGGWFSVPQLLVNDLSAHTQQIRSAHTQRL